MAGSSTVNSRKVLPPETRTLKLGNVFDNYLDSESESADGFDFPVGDADGKGAYADSSTGKRYDGGHRY